MHSCEYTVFVPKVKILDHAGTPLTATAVPSKVSLWDSVDRIQRTWQVDLSSPAQYFVIVSSQYDGVRAVATGNNAGAMQVSSPVGKIQVEIARMDTPTVADLP